MSKHPPLERLKHSRVVQAIGVYLGMSWAVLGAADLMESQFGLPDWVFTMTVILLLAGLAIVLATAWVQSLPSTTEAEEAGEIPSDWELAPAQALASIKSGRLPHLTWARAILGGVFAFSILFGVGGLYVVVTGDRLAFGPEEIGANEAAAGIAVLPFSVTGDHLEMWREGMVDLLAAGLDGVGGLRTIDSRTVLARWQETVGDRGVVDLEVALQAAGRTGARYGILGSAVALGPNVRMTADLYDLSDGSEVAQGSAEGPADSVLVLVDELGLDLMRGFLEEAGGETLAPQRIASLTTSSLPALSAFLEGEAHFRRGDLEEAVASMESALEADSTFSLALFRLYQAFGWLATVDDQKTQEVGDRLRRNLDGLPARDRAILEADMAIGDGTVWNDDDVEILVELYPDDPEAWNILGETHYHAMGPAQGGYRRAREAFERARELSPGFLPYYYHAIEMAIAAGDEAHAGELIEAISGLAPAGSTRVDGYRFALWAYQKASDPAEVADSVVALEDAAWVPLDLFESIPATPPSLNRLWHLTVAPDLGLQDPDFLEWAFDLSLATGRQEEALGLMRDFDATEVTPFVPLQFLANEVVGGVPADEMDRALAPEVCGASDHPHVLCTTAVALHALDRGRLADVRRRAALDRGIAGDLLAEDEEDHAKEHLVSAMILEGSVAWTEGDRNRALAKLDSATRTGRMSVGAWREAGYLEVEGYLEDAVAVLRTLDERELWAPFAHLRIAELLERMGERSDSRIYYESALAAWVEADDGFEPRRRAEQGLARIAGR